MIIRATFKTLLLFIFYSNLHVVNAGEFSPQLNGVVSFEIENDYGYSADNSKDELNILKTDIEPYFILSLNDRLALEAALVLERLKLDNDGENQTFNDHILVIEELKLSYYGDNYKLSLGKYNPSFGVAWDLAKGIVGKDFAKDYELKERVGFNASYVFQHEKIGRQTLTGNTFFLDTTFLSSSLNGNRDEKDLDDGGVSNTENLSSFSVTLDGENTANIKSLNTYLGYSNQEQGDADTSKENEIRYGLGTTYKVHLANNVTTTILGEWVGIRNYKGSPDIDRDYLTASAVTKINKQWNVTLAHTDRRIRERKKPTKTDYQFQLSGGYIFKNGFSIDAGYRRTEKSDKVSNGILTLLGYSYEF